MPQAKPLAIQQRTSTRNVSFYTLFIISFIWIWKFQFFRAVVFPSQLIRMWRQKLLSLLKSMWGMFQKCRDMSSNLWNMKSSAMKVFLLPQIDASIPATLMWGITCTRLRSSSVFRMLTRRTSKLWLSNGERKGEKISFFLGHFQHLLWGKMNVQDEETQSLLCPPN